MATRFITQRHFTESYYTTIANISLLVDSRYGQYDNCGFIGQFYDSLQLHRLVQSHSSFLQDLGMALGRRYTVMLYGAAKRLAMATTAVAVHINWFRHVIIDC